MHVYDFTSINVFYVIHVHVYFVITDSTAPLCVCTCQASSFGLCSLSFLALARTSLEASPQPEESKEMEASSEMQKEAVVSTSEGLLKSPALLFITRKDLYSFLSSAGVSLCCVCKWWLLSCPVCVNYMY